MVCSLYTFLVYFNAVRNVLGCWLRDYAPEVTLVDERNTRWGSSFFSWLLKQSASMSKTVRSLYIFTLLKHCSRLYKSAICLCLKVSCCSKYCWKISSWRHHKAQWALFVFEYGGDARASRWAERRRTVNFCHTCHTERRHWLRSTVLYRCTNLDLTGGEGESQGQRKAKLLASFSPMLFIWFGWNWMWWWSNSSRTSWDYFWVREITAVLLSA